MIEQRTTAVRAQFAQSQRAQATAAQYENTAFKLRQAARAIEETHDIENQAYWEWDQVQPPTQPLRLPVEFTAWTLVREAELLEARARVLRGER